MCLVVLVTIKMSMYYNLLLFIDLSANGSVWFMCTAPTEIDILRLRSKIVF